MPPLPLQSVYLTGNILSRFDNEMSCDLKLYTMNHWQTPEERERETTTTGPRRIVVS